MTAWIELIPLPPLVLWLTALVIGLAVLVKASDWFTSAADLLGRSFGLSPFVVGVTIMAVGTSLPELVSSVLAARASDLAQRRGRTRALVPGQASVRALRPDAGKRRSFIGDMVPCSEMPPRSSPATWSARTSPTSS